MRIPFQNFEKFIETKDMSIYVATSY